MTRGFKLGSKVTPGYVSEEFREKLRSFGWDYDAQTPRWTWRTLVLDVLAVLAFGIILLAAFVGGAL